jgi:hypothetical protein
VYRSRTGHVTCRIATDRHASGFALEAQVDGMDFGRYSLPLTIAAITTIVAASVLIWLLLYEPVALAGAVEQGDVTVVAEALGRALFRGIKALARYL